MSKKYTGHCLEKDCPGKEEEVCQTPFNSLSDNVLEIMVGLSTTAKCPKEHKFVEFEIRKNNIRKN